MHARGQKLTFRGDRSTISNEDEEQSDLASWSAMSLGWRANVGTRRTQLVACGELDAGDSLLFLSRVNFFSRARQENIA